ncbi:MAG: serine--tRNA ligase, partial [Bacteroidota bacterium]
MLQTSFIRENAEQLKAGLRKRNFSDEDLQLVDQAIQLDDQRKAQQTELDSLLASRNQMSGEIGQLFKSGQRDKAEELRAKVTELKERAGTLE